MTNNMIKKIITYQLIGMSLSILIFLFGSFWSVVDYILNKTLIDLYTPVNFQWWQIYFNQHYLTWLLMNDLLLFIWLWGLSSLLFGNALALVWTSFYFL